MRRQRGRARRHEQVELDITAFLNLMVILVPFLLITAVFSRLAILELELPRTSSGEGEPTPFQLEVVVRESVIELAAGDAGRLATFARREDGHDLAGLSVELQRIKAERPEHTQATLLLEAGVDYGELVRVMDVVRSTGATGELPVAAELFPDIALGDAPLQEG